jgi:hypothetical protein
MNIRSGMPEWPTLDAFVTRMGGTIDLGRLDRYEDVAVAATEDRVWVVLVRRPGETLAALLARLEAVLAASLADGEPHDELAGRLARPAAGAAPRLFQ